MIIGEALKSVFSGLTIEIANKTYDVQFHYGDQKELQQWILMRNSLKLQKYPLIWYVTNGYEQVTNDKFKVESQLILFQSTKREYLNTQRSNLTYLNSLNPLYLLVNKVLSRNPYLSIMNNGKPLKCKDEPNYGVQVNEQSDFQTKAAKGEKSITLDVVDAKILRLEMVIKPYCLIEEGSTPTPPPPPCQVPVISGIPNNQFRDRIYVTVGVAKNWQIIGSNNPTSYNANYGTIQGVTVNQQTGAVSYTALQANLGQTLTISFEATNNCGVGSLLRFVEPISSNVNILNAPINQNTYNINPNLPTRSFNYENEILPYDGTLTNYEVWVKGPAFQNQWFLYSNVTPSNENLIGNVQTFVGLGQHPGTYLVKTRIKNNLGEYSPYTNDFQVIIP
jgi:hypothetical protein